MYNFKDKKSNLSKANNETLAKTLTMFSWQNLPETIPQRELEYMLQVYGYAFIAEHEGNLYAFNGGLGGLPDVYGNPTEIVVANPGLKLNKTFNLKTEGVLIENDDMKNGIHNIINKFNSALIENEISLNMASINSRIRTVFSASDDKTKAGAEAYIDKIVGGEISVIGEAALFDGIKVQGGSSGQSNPINPIIELHQYFKASLSNELGLNSNYNMKRERLTSGEVEQGEDVLYPLIDNMNKCRNDGIIKLNEMFNLNVSVDYGSIWKRKNVDMNEGEETWKSKQSNKLLNESPELSLETSSKNGNESGEETLNESGEETLNESGEKLPPEDAKNLAEQISEAEEMLNDGSLSDEDKEVLNALISELKGE